MTFHGHNRPNGKRFRTREIQPKLEQIPHETEMLSLRLTDSAGIDPRLAFGNAAKLGKRKSHPLTTATARRSHKRHRRRHQTDCDTAATRAAQNSITCSRHGSSTQPRELGASVAWAGWSLLAVSLRATTLSLRCGCCVSAIDSGMVGLCVEVRCGGCWCLRLELFLRPAGSVGCSRLVARAVSAIPIRNPES
jgi:hypothetical protein